MADPVVDLIQRSNGLRLGDRSSASVADWLIRPSSDWLFLRLNER